MNHSHKTADLTALKDDREIVLNSYLSDKISNFKCGDKKDPWKQDAYASSLARSLYLKTILSRLYSLFVIYLMVVVLRK